MANKIKRKFFVTLCLGGKGGFTLVELVVAIGILVMVVGFSGVIFQRSIGSYRSAMAQAEVMRKLRVITEQLDSDFRGLRKDAPMFIWFAKGTDTKYDVNNRFDQIMFFADGDFQSTQTFNSEPVVGNVARIYYGHAQNPPGLPTIITPKTHFLSRRQHILTADASLPVWFDFSSPVSFTNTFTGPNNDANEYDSNSLSQWQAILNDPVNGSSYVKQLIFTCFMWRPVINLSNANTIHNLMTEGVGSFSIQWDYITDPTATPAGAHFWWPALDPDGNPATSNDSDFVGTYGRGNPFGIYFNSANPSSSIWFSPDGATGTYYPSVKPAYPKALKFVFTLYDSRNVFPNGQTFSHIVYLGD